MFAYLTKLVVWERSLGFLELRIFEGSVGGHHYGCCSRPSSELIRSHSMLVRATRNVAATPPSEKTKCDLRCDADQRTDEKFRASRCPGAWHRARSQRLRPFRPKRAELKAVAEFLSEHRDTLYRTEFRLCQGVRPTKGTRSRTRFSERSSATVSCATSTRWAAWPETCASSSFWICPMCDCAPPHFSGTRRWPHITHAASRSP